jgi:hypothetical protein
MLPPSRASLLQTTAAPYLSTGYTTPVDCVNTKKRLLCVLITQTRWPVALIPGAKATWYLEIHRASMPTSRLNRNGNPTFASQVMNAASGAS